ncbi:MAG: hypothetical protein NDJ89_01210 [Oligoflexia bacterium]|nr:hypothetical protein [Oligoflexia bacterium]
MKSKTPQFFTSQGEGLWAGDSYDLCIELGPRSDVRTNAALRALWGQPCLTGCYLKGDCEPDAQARVAPQLQSPEQHQEVLLGLIALPNGAVVPCGSRVVHQADGRDWLIFFMPMAALSKAFGLGGFPFLDRDETEGKRAELDQLLLGLARGVRSYVSFDLGLVGYDLLARVYGGVNLEIARRMAPQDRQELALLVAGEWRPRVSGAAVSVKPKDEASEEKPRRRFFPGKILSLLLSRF